MANYLNNFLFGIYPYIALMVFFVGSFARLKFVPYTVRASSSQAISNKGMLIGSNFFHIGILLLLIGHFFGLLTPHWAYSWLISAGTKQIIAMTAGGIFGTICLIGIVILLQRRLFNERVRATNKCGDLLVLVILFIQLVLGLMTIPVSANHLDGSSMIALAHWAQYIFTFQSGAADFILNQSIIFKLHIVLGLSIFLLFPFTRLIHVITAPVGYLFRTGYQIVRKRS